MFRISILCRLAVKHGFISAGDVTELLDAYKTAVATEPNLPFMQWAVRAGHLKKEQARQLKDSYPAVNLQCKSCGVRFRAGDTDIRQALVCPGCSSDQLEIVDLGAGASESGQTLLEIRSPDTAAGPSATTPPGTQMNTAMPHPPATVGGPGVAPSAIPTTAGPGAALASGSSRAEDFARLADEPLEDEIGVIPPGTVIGGCRIIQKMGQGGMGAVYKAHHLALDKSVALKILAPHLTENRQQILRFIREARSAAQLEHANIVQVMNVGEESRRFYLIMQWVEGESLQKLLDREGVLDQATAVRMVTQAARGLAEAHSKSIIHRDIKPDNLMITEQGVLKVADFGLAKATAKETEINVSQTGTILGTPYYMSPEQGQNSDVDHRTDIYSLGITLYQLITGKVPFTGQSAVQIIFKHIKEPMPPPRQLVPGIDPDLNAIVMKMTAKEPDERYQVMDDVVRDLERIYPRLSGEAPIGAHSTAETMGIVPPGATMQATGAGYSMGGAMPSAVGAHHQHPMPSGAMAPMPSSYPGMPISAGTPHPGMMPSGQPVIVMQQKSSAATTVLAVLVALLLVGGAGAGYYFGVHLPQQQPSQPTPTPIAHDTPRTNTHTGIDPQTQHTNDPGSHTGTDPITRPPSNQGTDNTAHNTTTPGDTSPPTNTGTGTGANTGTGTGTDVGVADARVRLARSRLKIIMDEWTSHTGRVEEYRQMAQRFQDLATEFADVTDIRTDAQDMAQRIRNLRDRSAREWLEVRAAESRTLIAAGRFVAALDLLNQFPAHFVGTDAYNEGQVRIAELRPKAELERRAVQIYESLQQALGQPESPGTLALAKRRLSELKAPEYSSVWCARDLASFETTIAEIDRRMQSSELRTLHSALVADVTRELGNDRFRAALARIARDKDRFAGTEFEQSVAQLQRDAQQRADRTFAEAKDRADRLAQTGAHEALFALLREVRTWGLDPHIAWADRFKADFIETFVTQQLQLAEDRRDGAAGLKLADELLRNEEFVVKRPLIERYQARYELLQAGMVPITVPGGEVRSPDGRSTWSMPEFWIDKHEVTNADFLEFVLANGYANKEFWSEEGWAQRESSEWVGPRNWSVGRPRTGTNNLPVTAINYWEAEAYAKWAKKRLPSAEQWMVAAGYDPTANNGRGGWRKYPWGNEFRLPTNEVPPNVPFVENRAMSLAVPGAFRHDRSAFGVMDMGGNVREWTQTPSPSPPPRVVVMGGFFGCAVSESPQRTQATYSELFWKMHEDPFTGFRLVNAPANERNE